MTVRFPKNSAVAALVDRLQHRIAALLRDFEDDLDDVLQEQHRASHAQGFQEGAHEIRHSDE